MQRHNGSLSLENAEHGGAKVRICLPQAGSASKYSEDTLEVVEKINVG